MSKFQIAILRRSPPRSSLKKNTVRFVEPTLDRGGERRKIAIWNFDIDCRQVY